MANQQRRTASQTIGPFFHEALRWKDGGTVSFSEDGEPIVLSGRLVDGDGQPVADAMIETWQLSPRGGVPAAATGGSHPHGIGRVETDASGTYRIETRMPGAREGQVPFIDFAIFARGLLKPLRTRVYFAAEALVRADPALAALADRERVKTLIAQPAGARGEFRWDVRLQGEGETIFFAT